jgi:hypothetical protein
LRSARGHLWQESRRYTCKLAQNPELELEVVLDDRQIDLVQEGIDVALRMGS